MSMRVSGRRNEEREGEEEEEEEEEFRPPTMKQKLMRLALEWIREEKE